jgi:menaquinone-dependent protoporphyrinogen IX oxidase
MKTTLRGLLVYATTFGATKATAEEIARILQEEQINIKIVNLEEEKIKDLSEYQLIIVGSSLAHCKWNSNVEDFLKRFQKEFTTKKLALFVSSVITIAEREGNTEEIAKIRKIAMTDTLQKYHLNPVMTGLFGGILDYNKMGFIARKGMEIAFKSRLQNTGFTEQQPGVYDLHNWEAIRTWAKELAKKTKE